MGRLETGGTEMAAGIVPNIRDEAVVCQEPCSHHDCAVSRQDWTGALCSKCGGPMMAGERFYYEGKGHVHALCLEQEG